MRGTDRLSRKKRRVFLFFSVVLTVVVISLLAELTVRVFFPPLCLPSYDPSLKYKHVLSKNAVLVHERPGRWRFIYTTNQYGYRGRAIAPLASSDKERIVVLGDSNGFGIGVNDGEEFPAVLDDKLKDHDVVNLSVPGYEIGHQIRRYYELGRLYSPKIVILQFCGNDPFDGVRFRVARIEDGRIEFNDLENRYQGLLRSSKRFSLAGFSQLYKLVQFEYLKARRRLQIRHYRHTAQSQPGVPFYEKQYIDLLAFFAYDLQREGVSLLMISPERQLYGFPYIKEEVFRLQREGLIAYYETADWLEDGIDYHSIEGHEWGKIAQGVVGARLAEIIKADFSL